MALAPTEIEWMAWDPKVHKRGGTPQCSRPGCREVPDETRASTMMRAGEERRFHHVFCAPHAVEEKAKES